MTYLVHFTASDGQKTEDFVTITTKNYKIDTLNLFKELEVELRNMLDTDIAVTLNSISECGEVLSYVDEH